jgi:hypothetical protein
MKEAREKFALRLLKPGKGSDNMKKFFLLFLTLLSLAPILSGCYYYPYHYRDDYYDRDYRYDRGYHGERGYYYDRRDGRRDYR